MKTIFLLLLASLLGSFGVQAQVLRYFEFKTQCGYNEWRDTSFIAATSDPAVIADVLNDLTKPLENRKLIIGTIAHGSGGYNRNATHTFNWHFVPGEWHLQEMAMEVCDGCPYSDIELNPAYWLDQIREFCPWTSSVSREVTQLMAEEEALPELDFTFFPNPTQGQVTVALPSAENLHITLTNALGQPVRRATNPTLPDLGDLPAGVYFLHVTQHGKTGTRKLIVN